MLNSGFALSTAVAGAALAGIAAAGYQAISPTSHWLGHSFSGLPRGAKQLALTYDDGPNDPYTLRLLDVLERHHVRCTFFVIGSYVRRQPALLRRLLEAGHVIGNHTFNHPLLLFQREADVRSELSACQDAIYEATGEQTRLFRPPYGGRRPTVLRIGRELGMEAVMWSVTGFDWDNPQASVIERNVSRQIRGGDVILLHDGGHTGLGADRSQTIQATDQLLTRYRDQGYEFLTIPEMMSSLPPA